MNRRNFIKGMIAGALSLPALLKLSFHRIEQVADRLKGKTYYVSAEGSDPASGLSPDVCWRTLEHACNEVEPGDTIMLKAGDAFKFPAKLPSGTQQAPITIAAYGTTKIFE